MNNDFLTMFNKLFLACIVVLASNVNAELSFDSSGNRFFLDATKDRANIRINNIGPTAVFIQAGIGLSDELASDNKDLPLALKPGFFVLEKNASKVIELFYQGKGLPSDRESLFILSVLELPKIHLKKNQMQVAMNHHLKVFWRPKDIKPAEEQIENLSWLYTGTPERYQVKLLNRSPNYLTLTNLQLHNTTDTCKTTIEYVQLKPLQSKEVIFPICNIAAERISFNFVRDDSSLLAMTVVLDEKQANKALPITSMINEK